MVKVFLDSAVLSEMIRLEPKVSGFTTNPTLLRKAGVINYESWAKIVASRFPDKPISFEVFGDDWDSIQDQAEKLSKLGENVYVKVPVVFTDGVPTYDLIKSLGRQKIKINVTAVMTEVQCRALAQYISRAVPSIVSIFAGRIADTGRDPVLSVNQACEVLGHLKNVEILWASTREVYNIKQASETGCHIITLTPDLIDKLHLVGKDLTEFSRETSEMFYNDAQKAGYSL